MESAVLTQRFDDELAAALIARQLVSRQQLEEALSLQVVMGGQLATSLWDLALAEESAVDKLCAELARVPHVPTNELQSIEAGVLALVPAAVVRRARVLPYRREGNILWVATCQPWDLGTLEQVAFRASQQLRCAWASEVTLARALHQHHDVPLPARVLLGPQVRPEMREDEIAHSQPALTGDLMSEESFESLYARDLATPEEAFEEESDLPLIELEEVIVKEQQAPLNTVNEALAALDEAADRLAVGNVLARFGLARGKRVVLLIRQRSYWSGWSGAGDGINPQSVSSLVVPAEPGTMFGLVSQTGAPYLGPLLEHRVHDLFLRALGGGKPLSVGLFPVHYRGRVVFGIYIDAGAGAHAPADLADLLVVAGRVPMALERVVQQRLGEAR